MKLLLIAAIAVSPLLSPIYAKDNSDVRRLQESGSVFAEIMGTPDKGIPQELLDHARCVVIVPGLKTAGFIVGVKYGTGNVSCRNKGGTGWSAPGTLRIEGGSFGFQIGASETDVVMLVMNDGGMDHILSSKVTLGGEASVAAGPVGRTATAQTDLQMHAEVLSWSRSQGLFIGIALEGASLRPDMDGNAVIYGRRIGNREILTSGVRVPRPAAKLIAELNRYSARENGHRSE